MLTSENIALSVSNAASQWDARTEMCEHKGISHPDSICDGAVEAGARALCRAYLETYGSIQHFNLEQGADDWWHERTEIWRRRTAAPNAIDSLRPGYELRSTTAEAVVEQAIRST
ncbi:methionine adenosyltransferase [Cupriavidus basilensis]